MGDQLILLVVGFALTTVVGGFFASWLQARQERARLDQAEREAARAFFEEVSRLLDRRLHRMRQLDSWLQDPGASADVDRLVRRYGEVVDEWNESWNRILSLALRYFGEDLRLYLDYQLGKRFVAAGQRLEHRIRAFRRDGVASSEPLGPVLKTLAGEVYTLNLQLIEAVQLGRVGRRLPGDRPRASQERARG
jgi:hypothetical protein